MATTTQDSEAKAVQAKKHHGASTMKAAQWDPTEQKVKINQIPIPEPKENQFLIKMGSASLCLSDIMSISIPAVHRNYPVTLGHEGAGYIHAMHPSAEGKGFQVGDPVGFLYIIGCCFECAGCQVHNNYCQDPKPLSEVQGFTQDGFFAEYAVTDYHSCIVLPKNIDAKKSSPLFCAGITAYNCVSSCGLVQGQTLAIVGCGGLGQYATQYAKAMGLTVVGVDISDEVLRIVQSVGADHTFNSLTNADTAKQVHNLTKGGVDAVAVFSNAAAAYRTAPAIVKLGGLILVAGLPEKGVTFDALEIACGKYKIKGDSTGIPSRMPAAVEFTAKHNVQPLIETYRSLEDVPQMLEKLRKGENTKRMMVSF